jgi:protein-disulfide isomerase/uncharacterized membrane protein
MTETQNKSSRSLPYAEKSPAIYLSQHFYDLKNGNAAFSSLCKAGAAMNCDVVSASRWAELIPGVPLASFAAAFFVGVFAISLLAQTEKWRVEASRALFALGAFGILVSFSYLIVMVFILKIGCLFCLGIDAANLSRNLLNPSQFRVLLAIPLASQVLVVGGLSLAFRSGIEAFPVEEMIQNTLNQPVVAVQNGPEFPSMGNADAPITIVEFSDFQCPHCQRAAMTFHNLQLRRPGLVRVVFRNYPLDSSCNLAVKGGGHQAACRAARGSYCANKQGKFQAYYEEVFENQTDITEEGITAMAQAAGLDEKAFGTCVDSDDAKAAVARDLQEGEALGIEATPTLFINGRKAAGAYPLPVWEMLIERLGSPVTHPTSGAR